MRGEHHLRQRQQRAVTQGLLGEDVECSSGHLAGPDHLRQRRLVDDPSPRRVDDPDPFAHLLQRLLADQPLGVLRLGEMDRDHVGVGVDTVEVVGELHPDPPGTLVADKGVVCEKRHSEGMGALRYQGADPAQPDHPQRLAVQLDPLEALPVPDTGSQRGVRPWHVARLREDQRHGVLRRRDHVGGGRIDHQHAGGGGRFQIDVVHSDPGPPDHLERRRSGDQLGVDGRSRPDQEPMGGPHQLDQLGAGGADGVDHLGVLAQLGEADGGDRLGYDNDRTGSHVSHCGGCTATATRWGAGVPT